MRLQTPTGNTSQTTLNPFLKGMQTETALTENGAVTNPTTLNALLDLFFIAGASRSMSKSEIEGLVGAAYAQDALATLKILFWARDVRG